MNRRILSALIAAAVCGIAACSSNSSTSSSTQPNGSMAPINTTCCCGKATDGKTFVMYKGQKIAMCSQQCADMFNKASDADKQAMVAKVTKK